MDRNLYEAMFVVDSAKGGSQFPDVIRHIAGLLNSHEADIDRIEKWDDRKLAYPIKGVEKGIYVLTYFTAPPNRIAELRQEIGMSEEVLRVLILKDPVKSEVVGELYDEEGSEIAPAPSAEVEEEAEEDESEEEDEAAEAEESEESAEDEDEEDTEAEEAEEEEVEEEETEED